MAKSYDHDCPVARTLDVIGERWTILILRDFFLSGPRRFQDFLEGLEGISPNTLSDRLKNVGGRRDRRAAVLRRASAEGRIPLTPKGNELGPVLLALRKWGDKHT